jgi:nitrile hydratase
LLDPDDVFHSQWERQVLGLTYSSFDADLLQLDRWRARQEELHPLDYVRMPYFERWLYTLERNLVLNGVLTEAEIEARLQEIGEDPDEGYAPPGAADDRVTPAAIDFSTREIRPPRLEAPLPPRFACGDPVRTRVIPIERPGDQHTRLPDYAQGCVGVVVRVLPVQRLPDLMVERMEPRPEHTYSVRLMVADLWGEEDPNASVCVDAWESYLEPAS